VIAISTKGKETSHASQYCPGPRGRFAPARRGALTPAFANYSQCDEQPNAEGCPTYAAPVPNGRAVIGRAYSRREAAHVTSRKLGSPFTAAHGMTAF